LPSGKCARRAATLAKADTFSVSSPEAIEKAGRVVKLSPRGPLVASYSRLGMQTALDGLGFFATFEGYVRDAVRSGALVSVLDDWCASFPGPFLYYPDRRQPPPALNAFVTFIAAWRKRKK
jgi:DNA-binding transcriptional LysR family regulator